MLFFIDLIDSREYLTLDDAKMGRIESMTPSPTVKRLASIGPNRWTASDVSELSKEVARRPNDYALRAARAEVALATGQAPVVETAIGYRGKAIFGSRVDRYEMGLVALSTGRDDLARMLQDSVLEDEPNYFECIAAANRGNRLNQPQDSRPALRRALKLKPGDFPASIMLVGAYVRGGMPGVGQTLPQDYVRNPKEALALARSLARQHRSKCLTFWYGCAADFADRRDEAIDLYRQYIANPDEGALGQKRVSAAKNNLALLLKRR